MSQLELPDDFRDVLVALADAGPSWLNVVASTPCGPTGGIGMKPLRIEVLTKITGVSFE